MTKRRNARFNQEAPNLKRFRASIEKFAASQQEEIESGENKKGSGTQPKKNRKRRRREERELKKAKKNAFYFKKAVPQTLSDLAASKKHVPTEEEVLLAKEKKKEKEKMKKIRKKEKKKEKRQQAELAKKRQVEEANQKDDKLIKQLEKQMKMNRRKSKSTPLAFKNDGLDYILDAVDHEKLQTLFDDAGSDDLDLIKGQGDSDEDSMEDFDSEDDVTEGSDGEENKSLEDSDEEEVGSFGEDEDERSESDEEETSKKTILKKDSKNNESGKSVKWSEDLVSTNPKKSKKKTVEIQEETFPTDSEESDSAEMNVEFDEGQFSGDSDSSKEEKLREDIYGRLRDKDGNIVKSGEKSATSSYIPPGKRMMMADDDEKRKIFKERLRKQIQGQLNRVTESTMQSISSLLESLYMNNSRADMNETVTDIIISMSLVPSLVPERLLQEQAMLITILHCNVGSEVGAYFIQMVARKFDELYASGNYQGKELDNLLGLLLHIHNFKVVHSLLIFDIIDRLCKRFTEKDIELVLLTLRTVGFSLRKDDPSSLKKVILQIQDKASSIDVTQFEDKSRVQFMLDVLLAIKNNNVRKIPNYDPSHIEHLRKILRSIIRGGSVSDSQLRISLSDLLCADAKGRWWIVGSAWSGRDGEETESLEDKPVNIISEANTDMLDLARKQRMNTEIRKNIFCIIMTGEDFVDAFEKLLHLGLKHQQEREIIHVITDCCLQEKAYNPYYSYLAQKFAEYDRRFQMTIQFGFWDKFKLLSTLSEHNLQNYGKFLTHLITSKALSLSILKVVEFAELDKSKVRLLKNILLGILTEQSESVVREVFLRIAPFPKLHMLREGLKLFMRHFLLRQKSKLPPLEVDLENRVKIAESAFSTVETKMRM